MHLTGITRGRAALWLIAACGCLLALLLTPALSRAEESNPNNYVCVGSISKGPPEEGSEEHQVQYVFHCDGPITGYQLESQIPVTGIQSPPTVVAIPTAAPLTDTFSCSGEEPGWAVNCVGATKGGYEQITGEFAVGANVCSEPREDPLLTVTYAYLEKGVVTQAISGPFDLGRPRGCPPDKYSGYDRLNPKPAAASKKHKKGNSKKKGKKK